MNQLPSFKLATTADGVNEIERLASQVFGLKRFVVQPEDDFFIAQEIGGARLVEWHPTTGVIWMADWSQLWNPDLCPTLLSKTEACEGGLRFLNDHGLLPTSNSTLRVAIGEPHCASTLKTPPGSDVPSIPLDMTVGLTVKGQVGDQQIPLNGRGSKWSVTFGNRGQIINCVAARVGIASSNLSDALPPPDALMNRGFVNREANDYFPLPLVYERFRDVENEDWLLPMFLGFVRSNAGPQLTRFPATTFSRDKLDALIARDARESRRNGLPDGQTLATVRKRGVLDSEGLGAVWSLAEDDLYGMRLTEGRIVVREMERRGWTMVRFEERRALEDHWNAKRADFVEKGDFAYFSGHAAKDGWNLSTPAKDKKLEVDDVRDPDDPVRYGQRSINWVIVSACGPLQDPAILPRVIVDDTAISRWGDLFEGLLGLCAFATVSIGHSDMGVVFAREVARTSVTRAWFRACRECQPFLESTSSLGGCGIWAATLTADDDQLRSYDMSITEGRTTRRRARPSRLLGVWTPV